MLVIFSIATLIALCNAQVLMNFKDLKPNGAINSISNGTVAVFVSAASDIQEPLTKITFVSATGNTTTAFELLKKRVLPQFDLLEPWISDGLTIVTTLNSTQLSSLTGFIYCTTEKQSKDSNFAVYEISQIQEIDVGAQSNATLVFLNSYFLRQPFQPTTFFDWVQVSQTSVSMYNGIPSDAPEPALTQIFSNPVFLGNATRFLPHVSSFSTTLGASYMRVRGSGVLRFKTGQQYIQLDNTQTNKATTTGFLMKSYNQVEQNTTILLMPNEGNYGITGVNSIADISTDAIVGAAVTTSTSGHAKMFQNSTTIVDWQVPKLGDKLQFLPTKTNGGQYFLQYFTIENGYVDSTTAAPTAVPSVSTISPQSTTQISTTSQYLFAVSFSVLSFLFF